MVSICTYNQVYVKTLACGIIPAFLYLHIVHKVNLLYNYTYAFNEIQNYRDSVHYRDIFLYYRDSRSHSLSPSPTAHNKSSFKNDQT